jgi:hypothetical protein
VSYSLTVHYTLYTIHYTPHPHVFLHVVIYLFLFLQFQGSPKDLADTLNTSFVEKEPVLLGVVRSMR